MEFSDCGQREGNLDFRLEQYLPASGAYRQSFCPASEIAVRDQGATRQTLDQPRQTGWSDIYHTAYGV